MLQFKFNKFNNLVIYSISCFTLIRRAKIPFILMYRLNVGSYKKIYTDFQRDIHNVIIINKVYET